MENSISQVRGANPADVGAIVDVLFRSWLYTYVPLGVTREGIVESFGDLKAKEEQYRKYLESIDGGSAIALVSERAGVINGLCFGHKIDNGFRLTQLYVDPDMIGKGIGSSLVEALFLKTHNIPIMLSVARDNTRAIEFYKRHSFVPTGENSTFQLTEKESFREIVMLRQQSTN